MPTALASCHAIRASLGGSGRAWRTLLRALLAFALALGMAVMLLGCASTRTLGPTRSDGGPVDLQRFRTDLAECEGQHDLQTRPRPSTYRESAAYYSRAVAGLRCMDERGWEYPRGR